MRSSNHCECTKSIYVKLLVLLFKNSLPSCNVIRTLLSNCIYKLSFDPFLREMQQIFLDHDISSVYQLSSSDLHDLSNFHQSAVTHAAC